MVYRADCQKLVFVSESAKLGLDPVRHVRVPKVFRNVEDFSTNFFSALMEEVNITIGHVARQFLEIRGKMREGMKGQNELRKAGIMYYEDVILSTGRKPGSGFSKKSKFARYGKKGQSLEKRVFLFFCSENIKIKN